MNLSQWLNDLKAYGDPGLAIVLVGNKADLCHSSESQPSDVYPTRPFRQVSQDEAQQWADQNGLAYIETSAKTGVNVEEVKPFFFSLHQSPTRFPQLFCISPLGFCYRCKDNPRLRSLGPTSTFHIQLSVY